MSQEFREDELDEVVEESTHISGGWSRPDEEDEILKELNDIIMDDDEEEEIYKEELRQRQYMAMEREKRTKRGRTGRMIGLLFVFISAILLILSVYGFYKGLAYSRSIKVLEEFNQDIKDEQKDSTLDEKTLNKITSRYMVAANVTDKTEKEAKEEAERKKEVEAAKAKEVAEKAKKAQEEANARQQVIQEEQRAQVEANNQNNLTPTQPQSQNQTQTASVEEKTNQYILPNVDSNYIPENIIAGLDAHQLYLARNEIYARHGRIFRKKDLQDYFGKQSWYKPTHSPDTFDSWGRGVFNQYENANLDLILKYEKK